MEYPYRKHPRLKSHDYSSAGVYYITICIKDRQQILWEPLTAGRDDLGTPQYCTEIRLTAVGKIIDKYIKLIPKNYKNISVKKYVIMPDHIHILLSLSSGGGRRAKDGTSSSSRPTSTSRIIGVLKRLINKEIGKNIFQASFYDHIIRNKDEYMEKWNYIENNPQKWIEKEIQKGV